MAMNNIFGLFANSPLKPLQSHSDKVTECCDLLIPFFEQTFINNWNKAELLRLEIAKCEHEADNLKREIRLKLPKGLFLPIDRTDLLELVTQQDKLANYAKDIVGRMIGRELHFPEEIQEKFLAYLKRSLDATHQANRVIAEMEQLLETGFKGRELRLVNDLINALDAIEDDTDQMQIQLRRMFLKIEDRYNPVDVMFLYKIIEWVGILADQAQRIGSRIELMLARS